MYIFLLELPEVCVTAAACWGERPAVVDLMQGELWCKTAPKNEDRSPAADAGRRCSSLKFQPDSLSAKKGLVKENYCRHNWNPCRRGSLTAHFNVLLPKWQHLQMNTVLVLKGRKGPVGLGSFPLLPTKSLAQCLPTQPRRDEEPGHTCDSELSLLCPWKALRDLPWSHKSAVRTSKLQIACTQILPQ